MGKNVFHSACAAIPGHSTKVRNLAALRTLFDALNQLRGPDCALRDEMLNQQSSRGETPLMAALRNKFPESMIPLLVEAGASPNCTDNVRNPRQGETVLDKVRNPNRRWTADQIRRNAKTTLILYLKEQMPSASSSADLPPPEETCLTNLELAA